MRQEGRRLFAVLCIVAGDILATPIPALLGRSRVGWESHLASGLAGPLLGLACFQRQSKGDSRRRRFVRFVRICSAVSLILLIVGAILGNVYVVALPQLRKKPS